MKLQKLNNRGVAHHFALAFLVVGIVVAGTLHTITSHAQVPREQGSTNVSASSGGSSASVNIKNPSFCSSSRPNVAYGQHSSCVAFLQSKIGAGVDGQFGGGTAAKVAAIQKANHLKDTSGHDVGPCTWSAIYHSSISASCKDGTVSASTSVKPSPLVYCTYTLNPGHRVVADAHISAAACKQHSGTARSTPTKVSAVPRTYKPSNLAGYKTAKLSISNNSCVTDTCYSDDTYELCATVWQISTKGSPANISFGFTRFDVSAAPDATYDAKTVTVSNDEKCRKMSFKGYGAKWEHVTATIKAGANSEITSAYFKAGKSGHTWNLTLTDALPN